MGLRARASSCIIEAIINKADARDSRTLVIVTSDHGCAGAHTSLHPPVVFLAPIPPPPLPRAPPAVGRGGLATARRAPRFDLGEAVCAGKRRES